MATAYGLVLGGALGNLIDRIRLGYVIDFIVVELPKLGFRWYTFNLADASLVVGVIMLLGYEFFGRKKAESVAGRPEAGNPAAGECQPGEGSDAAGLPR
jgi:signal peptidase II